MVSSTGQDFACFFQKEPRLDWLSPANFSSNMSCAPSFFASRDVVQQVEGVLLDKEASGGGECVVMLSTSFLHFFMESIYRFAKRYRVTTR